MTRSENAPKLDSSPDWWYFNVLINDHNRFTPDYTFIVDIAQSSPVVARMMSMTKFDGFGTAKRWLCILKKELPKQLTFSTWLKRANAWLQKRKPLWADQTPEVRQILCSTVNNTTVEDKNAFIQFLH